MGLDQLESTVLALPPDERRKFARWFYNHESEICGEKDEVSEFVRAELDRRSQELDANPALAVPVTDEWFRQLKQKFADARSAQASAV